ncbi:MAG: pilus assembly protein N-terminal domain-containing protein [Vitreimonas sp.]
MRLSTPRVLLVALAAAMFAGSAQAQDIRVAIDQSFPVRLANSAAGVAIGNPAIAGVSMQNDHFFFVTGKSYGTTNLTVVDANNHVMFSGRVVVAADESNVVRVTRGTETASLVCAPSCRPAPEIGDATFDTMSQQATSHASAAGASNH